MQDSTMKSILSLAGRVHFKHYLELDSEPGSIQVLENKRTIEPRINISLDSLDRIHGSSICLNTEQAQELVSTITRWLNTPIGT